VWWLTLTLTWYLPNKLYYGHLKEELETFSFWRRKIRDLNLSVGILMFTFLKKCPLKYSLIFWIGCAISHRKLNCKFSNMRLLNNLTGLEREPIYYKSCIARQASNPKALLISWKKIKTLSHISISLYLINYYNFFIGSESLFRLK